MHEEASYVLDIGYIFHKGQLTAIAIVINNSLPRNKAKDFYKLIKLYLLSRKVESITRPSARTQECICHCTLVNIERYPISPKFLLS